MSCLLTDPDLIRSAFPLALEMTPPSLPHSNYATPIPPIVWRTWKDNSWETECASAHEWTKTVLPDWTHHICDNTQCRAFIATTFEPRILRAYDACNFGVMRADLWRYLVLYYHGGLYLDMKTGVRLRPYFHTTNGPVPRVYSSPWDAQLHGVYHAHLFRIGELQQFWIAAEPGSPALWHVVCQIVANIETLLAASDDKDAQFILLPKHDCMKSRVISTTGPIAYTFALAEAASKDPRTVLICGHDCNQCINYYPPNTADLTSIRSDHYSKCTKPLVFRTF